MKTKARVIAFYLPQFHPIPENDENWGKGFTEWTNVASAKPLWKGHYQPKVPADLGFYDLRLPEIREAQADMAREVGVEGFMYWHYWFGGKMLLEKPAEWVLKAGKPDFPFCFGWANHEWSTATWTKGVKDKTKKMIAEMVYPGTEDNRAHFEYCLPFFKDHRYIQVDGKPLFMIYLPEDFIGLSLFMNEWQTWAKEAGLKGIYFFCCNTTYEKAKEMGFDGYCHNDKNPVLRELRHGRILNGIIKRAKAFFNLPGQVYDYTQVVSRIHPECTRKEDGFPIITPGYDHTARRGRQALIFKNSTPEAFRKHVRHALEVVKNKKDEHKIIFLQSWNEWGEGNYMEPDRKWGHAYLDVLRDEIVENNGDTDKAHD